MIKKKLASFVAAVLTTCLITTTAFAVDGYNYQEFEGYLRTIDGVGKLGDRDKTDDLEGVVYINKGLESGTTFMTFYIERIRTNKPATNEYDLWVNGRLGLPYKSGQGIIIEWYILYASVEPQANTNLIRYEGKWAP